jgi:DNA-binding NarL/FixJ family response regulator
LVRSSSSTPTASFERSFHSASARGHEAERDMAGNAGNLGTILIADHEVETRSLVACLLKKAGYDVVEADSGDDVIEAARRELPRLVILEVTLPALSGYELCHQLREEFGDGLPIILVSRERTEPYDHVAGLLIGADHYMVKPFAPDELLARVRRLVRSRAPVAPSVALKLTARETEVLRLLAEGLEQDGIAGQLFISRRTVGTHIENITRKLGVRSRAQAVALAYREELVKSS